MRMKSLFIAALATMALASCNKEEARKTPTGAVKTNFEVALPGAIDTYAVETPQVAGQITPLYSDVTVYLVDAGDNATTHGLMRISKPNQSASSKSYCLKR